jgi:nucleoside-diphosphate-sugar epimerase
MVSHAQTDQLRNCIIFGGAGFIGSHFAQHLIDLDLFDHVYLADINPMRPFYNFDQTKIHYVHVDVRNKIDQSLLPKSVMLIANFAAVHREPGHENDEYYETNLYGAENVCAFADKVGCKKIIFTSSIAPYGPSETPKDERSLTAPTTAYGGSKLAAEKIHQIWRMSDANANQLVIVRPGVVFGPGEGGNVTRLIKAVTHRYFFYMANKDTRKAGVYVKELCNAMWWVLQAQTKTKEKFSLFNMTMSPAPSIKNYVDTVCEVSNFKRYVPSVPYFFLLMMAYLIEVITKPLGIKNSFSPVRIKKLVNSNNIVPNYLVKNNYPYLFSLKTAFADWKKDCPNDWQ